jgi:glycosyltransferase involved in cell wall biosynthesis
MKPEISVIVPVYNNPLGVAKTIEALLNQSLPPQEYEIIIVDNRSTDDTPRVINAYVQQYPERIIGLSENRIQNSFAARNKGLSEARGEIIANTDSDCIPARNWLEEGISCMKSEQAQLVGGKVTFFMSEKQTPAEICDAIKNLRMEYYVRKKQAAVTANLFVEKAVLDTIGPFSNTLIAGEDLMWPKKAVSAGFSLVYAPKAMVLHPARDFQELMKKHYRVGSSSIHFWKFQGKNKWKIFRSFLIGFLPNKPKTIRKLMEENGDPKVQNKFWRVWFVAWLCNFATSLGCIRSTISRI